MPLLDIERIIDLMGDPDHMRNISIISSTDSASSNIINILLAKARILLKIPNEYLYYSTRKDSSETIYVKYPTSMLSYESTLNDSIEKNTYLINLVSLSPYSYFSAQFNDNLRIIDGIVIAIDCQDHLSSQTDLLIRKAICEKVKPVLVLENLDRNILELQQDAETIYQNALKAIENVNIVLFSYQQFDMDTVVSSPEKGNVAFISEKHGWGFTLRTFANMYSKKFALETSKFMTMLWGDNYFDSDKNKWITTLTNENGKSLQRGFNQFIMEPIIKLSRCVMDGNEEQLDNLLEIIDLKISAEDRELKGNKLLRCIMSKWLCLADCLLEMTVVYLPSPKHAQKYRTSCLYEGPQDDICAQAMRECDPKGPLMVCISQMVPTARAGGRFYAMGRIFSGTVKTGQQVRIMGPNYRQGKKEDLAIKSIQRVIIIDHKNDPISVVDASPGSIVYLAGIDQYIKKAATLSDCEEAHKIKTLQYSLSPVMRVKIGPKNPADLPRLIEGLHRLSKTDTLVQVGYEDTGEHFIAGCLDLHIEACLKSLQEDIDCEINQSELIPIYKETISQTSQLCMAKSGNKHNRLYCVSQPFSKELASTIEKHEIGPNDDKNLRTQRLVEEFDWEMEDAKRIWTFGPDNNGSNILVDMTKGVQFINEIRDSCDIGFQWAMKEGILCEEKVRQIRANLLDANLHSDAIHRGGGQIIPAARRVFYACQLTAHPKLQEPVFLIEIISTEGVLSKVYQCLNKRRGVILEEKTVDGTPILTVRLSVDESIGFSKELLSLTGGNAYANIISCEWTQIDDDPLDESTNVFKLVQNVRRLKGLRENIPELTNFMDNL